MSFCRHISDSSMLIPALLLCLCCSYGFSPITIRPRRPAILASHPITSSTSVLPSTNHCPLHSSMQQDDDFSFDKIEKNQNSPLDSSSHSLGIDFGQHLVPGSDEDYQSLKKACSEMIDEKVQQGLLELHKLHEKWQRDLERQQDSLEQAMTLNGIKESKKFNQKVDLLIGGFMNQTSVSRAQTHQLALEDDLRLKAEERERETKKKKKDKAPSFNDWKKTNNEWDEWEEEW